MVRNFWKIVDSVMREADILLLVLDARMIERTDNPEIRKKAKRQGKTVITVINKADLVDKAYLEPWKKKMRPCVFVSAQKFYGMTMLRHAILRHADATPVSVGVVGYPNTGKSSVINALKGRSSAPVSSVSGFTKGRQNIKVDNKIRVVDTPGVIANTDDKGSVELKISASTNVSEDPDLVVFQLLKDYGEVILAHYGLDIADYSDEEDMLEAIAVKLNRFKSGSEPDIMTAARMVIQDWQRGEFLL
ncbi:MAG: GTPase [Candidatus Woesearchaeota archaeon]